MEVRQSINFRKLVVSGLLLVVSLFAIPLGLAMLQESKQAAAIEPDGFACDGTFYQVRGGLATGEMSRIYRINRDSEPYTSTALTSGAGLNGSQIYNGLAYNPVTGYMHAWGVGTREFVTIANDGEIKSTHTFPGTERISMQGATMDKNGVYYAMMDHNNQRTLIVIDTRQSHLQIEERQLNDPSDTYRGTVGDLALDPTDPNTVYVITNGGSPPNTDPRPDSPYLSKINLTTNRYDIVGPTPASSGSLFFDSAGTLYSYVNGGNGNVAQFTQVDKTTGRMTTINTSDEASTTDGASCAFSPVKIDTVKSRTNTTVVNPTTFDITFRLVVGNLSDTLATNVQLTEKLDRTFATGNPTITVPSAPTIQSGSTSTAADGLCEVNPTFNGLSDTRLLTGTKGLNTGERCIIQFTTRVAYPNVASVPSDTQYNTVYASSTSRPNQGYTFNSSGDPTPPIDLLSADESTDGTELPNEPGGDRPRETPVDLPLSSFDFDKFRRGDVADTNNNGIQGDAGDTITYGFRVTNTGNTTLSDIKITDAKLGITDRACVTSAAPLAPGANVECPGTFTYVITAADVTAGNVHNVATATGHDLPPKTDEEITTTRTASPGIRFTKRSLGVADTSNNGITGDAGDTIAYEFEVQNTGNTILNNIRLTDAKLGVNNLVCAASLTPNEIVKCPGIFTYVITAADAQAGTVHNEATVTVPGLTPPPSIVDVPTVNPAFDFDKYTKNIEDTNNNGIEGDIGDTIFYGFRVENTGTAVLTDIRINDAKLGVTNLACVTSAAPLAVGAEVECPGTFRYVITAADAQVGSVRNVATATGHNLPPETDEEITQVKDPRYDFTKRSKGVEDTNKNGVVGDAGDTISYGFTVHNTGNTTITSVRITDAKLNLTNLACVTSATPLAPDAEVECPGEFKYVIKAEDAKAGTVRNEATATVPGLPPSTSVVDVPTKDPSFTLDKKTKNVEDTNKNGVTGDAGDTVFYSFKIKNTGNADLTTVKLNDEKIGVKDHECIANGSLAPDAEVECPGEFKYVITFVDVAKGNVHNVATATIPGLPPVTDEEETPTKESPQQPLANTGVTVLGSIAGAVGLLGGGAVLLARFRRAA